MNTGKCGFYLHAPAMHSFLRKETQTMATLSLPLEDNLLQRAQSMAATQGTTVSALLQGFVQNYADKSVACQQVTISA